MRSVITVLGKDKTGIIANISTLLHKLDINIDCINQAILDDLFTMVMLVETGHMNVAYDTVQEELRKIGETLGLDIRIQREEIFHTMHRI